MYPYIDNPTCLEWYAFDFAKNASDSTRSYIGSNDGLQNNLSRGLLKNVL